MKQRVVGAIAISCEPKVIIADEPTTSLDVTIQAQYLRSAREIQEARNPPSPIFITHDFGIVAKMCDRDGDVCRSGRGDGRCGTSSTTSSHPHTRRPCCTLCPHGRGRGAASIRSPASRPRLGTSPPAAGSPPGVHMPMTGAGADILPAHRGRRPYCSLLKIGERMDAGQSSAPTVCGSTSGHPGPAVDESHRLGHAVDGIDFCGAPGDARPGGRVGLRQDDDRQADPATGAPDPGQVLSTDDVHSRAVTPQEYRTTVQAVFQDPWSSLSPAMRVREIVAEPLGQPEGVVGRRSKSASPRSWTARPAPAAGQPLPHEFSGSASAWPWPAPWSPIPSSSSSTSRSRPWTFRFGRRS